MPNLTDTQSTILIAAGRRTQNLALPLPAGLVGAAAKMSLSKMIEHGWLQEVDANLRRNEPLWRETGDGHGTTLMATEAGLLAIGIEATVAQTMARLRGQGALHQRKVSIKTAKNYRKATAKTPIQRTGLKQAMLIERHGAKGGATMAAIIAATSCQSHSVRGAISGGLGKRMGLTIASAKSANGISVCRIV